MPLLLIIQYNARVPLAKLDNKVSTHNWLVS